jgi:endonuclease V-like protein UPF0215 family
MGRPAQSTEKATQRSRHLEIFIIFILSIIFNTFNTVNTVNYFQPTNICPPQLAFLGVTSDPRSGDHAPSEIE